MRLGAEFEMSALYALPVCAKKKAPHVGERSETSHRKTSEKRVQKKLQLRLPFSGNFSPSRGNLVSDAEGGLKWAEMDRNVFFP